MLTICLALIIAISIVIDTLRIGISPMPTSPKVWATLKQVTPDKPPKTIYELGCGFGWLSILLARKYPTSQVIAFEKAFVPYLVSKVISFFISNLQVRWEDFLKVDLTESELLVCYLFPQGMQQLAQKPMKGLLISHTFSLPGYQPYEERVAEDLYKTRVYAYWV